MQPIKMILHCPACGMQHIDAPEESDPATWTPEKYGNWTNPPHRSHLCHGCGHIWRPADVPTEGVREIATRGKNDAPKPGPLVPFPEFRNVRDVYAYTEFSAVVSFVSCRVAGVFVRELSNLIKKKGI